MTLLLINFSFSVGLIVTVQYYKLHLSHAICITLMYTADYRLRRQITLLRISGQKVRSARHNAVKHDSRLVTRFYGVTS